MSWKQTTLGDVLDFKYGQSLPDRVRADGDFPVYGSGGIVGTHNDPLVKGPGVIVGRKGTVGSVFWEKQDFFPIDTTYYLLPNSEDINLQFAYYLLKTIPLSGFNTDAAVPGLNRKNALRISIKLPSRQIQSRLVDLLSAYDDLNENNRRRMVLLEEAARQLYQEWFGRLKFPGHEHTRIIDGVPEGWARVPTPEAIEINPKYKLSDEEMHWWVEMSDLSQDSMVIQNAIMRGGRSGSKFHNGDTLLARITPCLENGKTCFVNFMAEGDIGRGSTEFIVLRSKYLTPEFVYCLSRTYHFRENAIKSMIGASGRQRVQESCFDKFFVIVPTPALLSLFTESVEPIFRQIKTLHTQNQKLKSARDILLPRLMSGEISV